MSAPEWLVPGAEVIVTAGAMYGVDVLDARLGRVAKVGKVHFTVEGVREGFSGRDDLPLVKFSVAKRMRGHSGANDSRMTAAPVDDEDARRTLATVARRAAESQVSWAYDRWRKATQEQVYSRVINGDRGSALFELADAITALRSLYDEQGIVADQPNVD